LVITISKPVFTSVVLMRLLKVEPAVDGAAVLFHGEAAFCAAFTFWLISTTPAATIASSTLL